MSSLPHTPNSCPLLPPQSHPSHQAFPSAGTAYSPVVPSIGSLLFSSPHSQHKSHPSQQYYPPQSSQNLNTSQLSHSLHNGHSGHNGVSSSSASPSPRGHPSVGQDGFSGLPPLPATGLASLPSYVPVYQAIPPPARQGSRPLPPPPASYPIPASPLRPPPSRHAPQQVGAKLLLKNSI